MWATRSAVGIDEANHGLILIRALHLERSHDATGPNPVADRHQATRDLVVRVSTPPVAARLRRSGGRLIHIECLPDARGDAVHQDTAPGLEASRDGWLQRLQESNQIFPILRGELQAKLVPLDGARTHVEASGHVVALQARRIEPLLKRFRLAGMAERVAIPNAA